MSTSAQASGPVGPVAVAAEGQSGSASWWVSAAGSPQFRTFGAGLVNFDYGQSEAICHLVPHMARKWRVRFESVVRLLKPPSNQAAETLHNQISDVWKSLTSGLFVEITNRITSRERIDRSFWNPVALREAVINAIIHNDYTTELVPKFEIFSDRIEITSAGTIQPGQEREDFFAGYSNPRNKTLMRVFRDLEMVEYLGSGTPRILKAYPREAFEFSGRFIRAVFPVDPEVFKLAQVEDEKTSVKILELLKESPEMTLAEIAAIVGKSVRAIEMASAKLVKEGKLRYVGPKKGGHWKVVE